MKKVMPRGTMGAVAKRTRTTPPITGARTSTGADGGERKQSKRTAIPPPEKRLAGGFFCVVACHSRDAEQRGIRA